MDGGPGGLRGVTEGQTRLSTVIEETPARHPQSVLKKQFTSEILIKPLPKLFSDGEVHLGLSLRVGLYGAVSVMSEWSVQGTLCPCPPKLNSSVMLLSGHQKLKRVQQTSICRQLGSLMFSAGPY